MRFMLIVKATGYSEAGVKNAPEDEEAMEAYRKSLAGAGALLVSEKLLPSSAGLRIVRPPEGGEPHMTAGPFPLDEGLMSEFSLIEARTEEEAVEWALRMPVPARRGGSVIELRKLDDSSDKGRDPRIPALEAELEDQLGMLRRSK
ncbi:dehydrogenase [Cohnella xylanilytica]|uniref:YciI family protein n=1 Tax=Cohnella xylanilytica TaxID=557555 RepID=UPI001B20031A|nr:YciI family protein [Cohnella xylanilytica]GIO15825.1 dehydrogenase [Cohnella xylanilytica]